MLSREKQEKLRDVQDLAVDNAIDEIEGTRALTLESKEERGDRFWLTKMATQSFTLAAKIESFIMLRNRETGVEADKNDNQAADRLIRQARAEVVSIMDRMQDGYKPRSK